MSSIIEPEVFIRRVDYSKGFEFQMRHRFNEQDLWAMAQPVEFKEIADGVAWVEPMMTLTPRAAQRVMDELWQEGLRPTQGSGSAGSLAATESHLKDMRRIVESAWGLKFD